MSYGLIWIDLKRSLGNDIKKIRNFISGAGIMFIIKFNWRLYHGGR